MRPDPPFMGFDFESTLNKIARVLTRQYDVQIVFSPHGPRIERNKIILPELTGFDAADSAARDVLVGYLDLLVARAKYSALAQMNAASRTHSGFERRLAQVIEDRRVAQCLQHDYPGARVFFGCLRRHAAADAQSRWAKLSWSARFLWAIESALWDDALPADDAEGSLQASLAAVQNALQQARSSRSSSESLAAASEIGARLKLLGAGGINSMMFSADVAGLHDSAQESDLADLTDDQAEDEGDLNGGAASQPPSGAAALDSAELDTVGMSAAAPGMGAAAPEINAAAEQTSAQTFYQRPILSIPLSTEFDLVTDLTGQGDSAAWQTLRSAARAETGALKSKLERALKADEWTHWQGEQERGAIDRTALVRLATVPGYRTPFKVQRVKPGRDSAVTLLLDLSGSMAGEKIALARHCAAALADALTQLDFACEVLGYSSVESPDMRALRDAQLAAGADLRRYNRLVERLDLRIYKRFSSNDLSGIAAIECGHENPDGECLAWAANRLAEHTAERRILMVLSDGYPATGDGNPAILKTDLQQRVRAIAARGIELIGVGIQDEAVDTFYPDAVVVHKLGELATTAFSVLSKRLLQGDKR